MGDTSSTSETGVGVLAARRGGAKAVGTVDGDSGELEWAGARGQEGDGGREQKRDM
jgi:hypothetical protein